MADVQGIRLLRTVQCHDDDDDHGSDDYELMILGDDDGTDDHYDTMLQHFHYLPSLYG